MRMTKKELLEEIKICAKMEQHMLDRAWESRDKYDFADSERWCKRRLRYEEEAQNVYGISYTDVARARDDGFRSVYHDED